MFCGLNSRCLGVGVVMGLAALAVVVQDRVVLVQGEVAVALALLVRVVVELGGEEVQDRVMGVQGGVVVALAMMVRVLVVQGGVLVVVAEAVPVVVVLPAAAVLAAEAQDVGGVGVDEVSNAPRSRRLNKWK